MKNLYARDALTWPVNLLSIIVDEIRTGDFQPDLRRRHCQLKKDVYKKALNGHDSGMPYLDVLEKWERDRSKEHPPTYCDEKAVKQIREAYLPDLMQITTIPPEANHETLPEVLDEPVLEIIEREAQESDRSGEEVESESEKEAKPETTKESLAAIAAHLQEEITKEGEDKLFLYDLNDEVVHVQDNGKALCWANWWPDKIHTRKRACVFINDVGTSDICPRCAGWIREDS